MPIENIIRIARRVDHAPCRRVRQGGGGDNRDRDGKQPEGHGLRAARAASGEGCIYRQNPAKNAPEHILVSDMASSRRCAAAELQRLMRNPAYELAIVGSTPLAGLLAGLLASEHRRRVVLVAEASTAFRLAQGFDLAAGPITRPETWALLRDGTKETLKLIGRIGGRAAVRRIDPLFICEMEESAAALSHMWHVALGFGLAVERRTMPGVLPGVAFRARDVALLDRPTLGAALAGWHAKLGVQRLDAGNTNAVISRDGSVRLHAGGQTIEAAHAVLADDIAVAAHIDDATSDPVLGLLPTTVMATEPTRKLAAPAMVGSCLAGHGPLKRVGQRVFRSVVTRDGGPLIESRAGRGASLVAGLGMAGAFFAPALARLFAGVAGGGEAEYFSRRGAAGDRRMIADYVAPPAREART